MSYLVNMIKELKGDYLHFIATLIRIMKHVVPQGEWLFDEW